jgi:hypothetical protein
MELYELVERPSQIYSRQNHNEKYQPAQSTISIAGFRTPNSIVQPALVVILGVDCVIVVFEPDTVIVDGVPP